MSRKQPWDDWDPDMADGIRFAPADPLQAEVDPAPEREQLALRMVKQGLPWLEQYRKVMQRGRRGRIR
ncbi:MAG: hypothetical protein EYC70_00345 [Planctomycetota bacterium]|nr:MAG: hypothetical protein EYC70_00345 [Planctomycetota bacterium]